MPTKQANDGSLFLIATEFPCYQEKFHSITGYLLNMGHYIHGFIAKTDALQHAALTLTDARCVPLDLGFSFLPVTDSLVAESDNAPHDILHCLSSRLIQWAELASKESPIAYIETEYHGGMGSQSSIVWSAGQCVFGPTETVDGYRDGKMIETPLLDGAINQSVRHLGVDRGNVSDEFGALGLGWHRSNEDWLKDNGK